MVDRAPSASSRPYVPTVGAGGVRGSVAEHFAREQLALRAGAPTALVAVVGSPAPVVSFGVGVHRAATYLADAQQVSVRTLARTTGGTGVLHGTDDVLWSLVLPRADPRVGRDFVRAYARLGAPIIAALGELGVPASWEEAPGLSVEYCPLGERGRVLASEGRILGGAAQHATREALLHHGAIAWAVDRVRIGELCRATPPAAIGRLAGVAEIAPGLAPERLADRVRTALVDFARAAPPA